MRKHRAPLPDLAAIRAAVAVVCRDKPVARVEVFGSAATGRRHGGSDVDLLIEFDPGADVGLIEMGALKEELEQRLGCAVDLVSRRAVERSRNSFRRRSILAESIPVYGG